jgi:hypothetical protein
LEQLGVQRRLIAQEQKPFGIRIQAADGVNARGELKFRQRAVARSVRGEPGKHPVWLMEGNQHPKQAWHAQNSAPEIFRNIFTWTAFVQAPSLEWAA